MRYEPYKFITILFFYVILVSSFILWLPISHLEGASISFIDSFFTATSALCVTGLNTIDFANTFNFFGLTIIALLIQLGGLGIICAAILLFIKLGKKIGLKQRILIKNSFNLNSLKGIVKFVLSVFKITLGIELIGAILLFIRYIFNYNVFKSIFLSLFHSISSFNNAGFDIISKYGLFDDYSKVVTMILIILGGIGFLVISEIVEKGFKTLSLQTKIVLLTTTLLLVFGSIGYLLTTELGLFDSIFLSVSTRTAGFCYWDLSSISNAGYIISIFLMFIGASPNSTGGGIKTVTFFVLILAIYSICRGRNFEIFKRRISNSTISKCLVVLLSAILIIFMATFLICCFEPTLGIREIFFEIISAYATVGLSLGITSGLSVASKIVLCIVMFIGRVGTLTLLSILLKEDQKNIKYPEENIIVG